MAFSFRVGTNWCHDFPKLARESGFHFNTHKSRVRVDWNRISFIDIDKVIQDRDFSTIDENVNNVIDYCLESEYNTQILDGNFVKLFRLAQLAVEYLLYCKQYLDQGVVILKDELRAKIEDNAKLKKQIITLEETIKEMKEQPKENSKLVETKAVDSYKEIFKCPHCPKTFVSSMFVSAHIARRHSFIPDLMYASSPIHEQYRAETEKLHSEIKTLKERLNETERIMRKENESLPEKINAKHSFDTLEERQKKYHEDITHLKNILLNEIQNSRSKDKNLLPIVENSPETKVKSLIDQQEREIQRLKDQLVGRLTPDIQSMQNKLKLQEDYWQKKIEHLEQQHQIDIENLTSQLKVTRDVSNRVKLEYASKVNDLEKQSLNQSRILIEQGQKLDLMKSEIKESHPPKEDVEDIYRMLGKLCKSSAMERSHECNSDSSNSLKLVEKRPQSSNKVQKSRILKDIPKENRIRKKLKSQKISKSNHSMFDQTTQNSLLHKQSNAMTLVKHETFLKDAYPNAKNYDMKNSETETESSQSTGAEYEFTSQSSSSSTEQEDLISDKMEKTKFPMNNMSLSSLKDNLQYELDERLKSLGIDPEWKDIPQATFLQKEQILKHHRNISSRKIPRYSEIKRKIVEKIHQRLSIIKQYPFSSKSKTAHADKKALVQRKNAMTDLKEYIESSNQSSISSMEENDTILRFNKNNEFITSGYLKSHKTLINSSPRNNRSVLKASTGSNSSLIKKKVLFALDKEKTAKGDLKHAKSLGDLSSKHEKQGVNDRWSDFSNLKGNNETLQKSKSMSIDNIVLKTTQSEKIAQISQKIQQQLSLPREKPPGAIETVFMINHEHSTDEDDDNQNCTSVNSFINEQPQPAPRNLKAKKSIIVKEMQKSKPQDSDLDLDIEEILSLE